MLSICSGPDERRAPASIVSRAWSIPKLIRLSRRGSNLLHINACSATVILARLRRHVHSFPLAFPIDAFAAVQTASRFNRKSSPYLSDAQASRAFLAAMATTAFQQPRRSTRLRAQRLEAILLVTKATEDRSRAHHKQVPEVAVAGLGDATEPGLATAAVLPRRQPDPRGYLAAIAEFVRAPPRLASSALAVVGPMPGVA